MHLRTRRTADLPACVAALRSVHETDGYPLSWPLDPAAWLTPPLLAHAWLAELPDLGLAGHIAIQTTAAPPTAAPPNAAQSGAAPTGAAPSNAGQSGTAPTGTAPTGTAPTGTAPTGTAPSNGTQSGATPAGAGPGDGVQPDGVSSAVLGAAAEISRLYVVPAARRRGVAEALMDRAAQWARLRRLPLVLEVVDEGRSSAIAFYESHGWQYTGTTVADWTGPGGSPVKLRHYRRGD